MTRLLPNLKRILRRQKTRKLPEAMATDILMRRAAEDSADFIEHHLQSALLISRPERIWPYVMDHLLGTGLLMELGVYSGGTINTFADLLSDKGDDRLIYGFDAFRGLSEDWPGKALAKHRAFNRKGKAPEVRRNVELVVGWVEETLAPFLDRHAGPIAFMHIDTDTYSPCRLALELCRGRFVEGTLLLLDEHHGYPNWRNGEFKALNESLPAGSYNYIAFGPQQALLQIASGIAA
jgi:hypothetical protein